MGMGARRNTEDELNASKMSWNAMNQGGVPAHDDDIDSNAQEMSTSEVGHVRHRTITFLAHLHH
jgi:hypothetical protein